MDTKKLVVGQEILVSAGTGYGGTGLWRNGGNGFAGPPPMPLASPADAAFDHPGIGCAVAGETSSCCIMAAADLAPDAEDPPLTVEKRYISRSRPSVRVGGPLRIRPSKLTQA